MLYNITELQNRLLDELKLIDPNSVIIWDEARGVASSVSGNLTHGDGDPNALEPTFNNFLRQFGALFGPPDLERTIKLLGVQTDDLAWTHFEFQQVYTTKTNPNKQSLTFAVYASKLAAHYRPDGFLVEVQSSCWRDIQLQDDREKVTVEGLRNLLMKSLSNAPGFGELHKYMQEQQEIDFPIMETPLLMIYPWQGGFRLTWTTHAFGVINIQDPSGHPTGSKSLELGQVFVDAITGEQFIFAPTKRDVETPDSGSGLGVTPLGAPSLRRLEIVHVDSSLKYLLKDKTHSRDIVTFDNGGTRYDWDKIGGELAKGNIPISEDVEGDKRWDRIATDTTDAQRTASQQPEVDAHYICGEIFKWYDVLAGPAGRKGWDDGKYTDTQPVRVLTHFNNPGVGTRLPNAWATFDISGGTRYYYLAFCDGDPTRTCDKPNDKAFDYWSGSKFIVAHEYQHHITNFSFGNLFIFLGGGSIILPGYPITDWHAAVHEGLSDVFGCLFSETWDPGREISSVKPGLVFRNLAFPRDAMSFCNSKESTAAAPGVSSSTCGFANKNKDHFGDRNSTSTHAECYDRGTILAHCAYLMGKGGVHERSSRKPELIPVRYLGRELGTKVLKAARIWYSALTYYSGTFGAVTGIPDNDEKTFRKLRESCISAAKAIYKENSYEYKTTVLAFYAVGLHPTSYGADVAFLTWGADWYMSRPHIGILSPDWSSMDLFINNGGKSEWNAKINVPDASGKPTKFENNVYCRVRNIGDKAAKNIKVKFSYAPFGTGITSTWKPMKDKSGIDQNLDIANLDPGSSNFPDSDQNTPPTVASVKWCIPPLAAGESVNHFCIKAEATCTDDVNNHNNVVQSNIAYVKYSPAVGSKMAFTVGNPTDTSIPLELHMDTTLPNEWNVSIQKTTQVSLEPGEEKTVFAVINMPEGAEQQLDLPLDGEVYGQVFGPISGSITGALTETRLDQDELQGHLSAHLADIGIVIGTFKGSINLFTGQIKGKIFGTFQSTGETDTESGSKCIGIEACLRPLRRINISQMANGEAIGGITIQVQVPMPVGSCMEERMLPPTDIFLD